MPNQAAGVFWAIVNHLLIILEVIILLLSEVGWPMKYFDRFFPVLGTEFGLGALGIFQALCVFDRLPPCISILTCPLFIQDRRQRALPPLR